MSGAIRRAMREFSTAKWKFNNECTTVKKASGDKRVSHVDKPVHLHPLRLSFPGNLFWDPIPRCIDSEYGGSRKA